VNKDDIKVAISDQTRYTLNEAKRVLARQECGIHGHDWEIIRSMGDEPKALICARCGESRKVVREST
jgi:hypothetical protein